MTLIKTCPKCRATFLCEGECKHEGRVYDDTGCYCRECIITSNNYGSVEEYKKRMCRRGSNTKVFCRSRFNEDFEEKVIFT